MITPDMPTPSHWKRTTLGELYEIGSSKRVLQKQWTKSGVPFYRAREIVRLARFGEVENDLFIAEEHFEELRSKHGVPKAGDLMVSAVGTLGACYVVQPNDRFYFKDASVLWFQPKQAIDPRFMQYAFLWDGLLKRVKASDGATVGTFTISRARATELDVPPLDEQKRIVAVLDQAFAALDRARAHAEANLADAGRLLLQIAESELLSLGRAGRYTPVSEIADHCLGKMLDKKKNKGSLRPYLRNLNVRWFEIDESDVLEMRIEEKEADRYSVERGDLLICEGGYPGRASIYDSNREVYFQKALHRVRFSDPSLAKILMYWLFAQDKLGKLKQHFTGTGISHFTGKSLAAFQMPIGNRETNKNVAAAIDRALNRTRGLSIAYEAQLNELADLRQSLLQKAFSGQLI